MVSFFDFKVFQTYSLTFKEDIFQVTEYIHCFVIEHLEFDYNGNPSLIKVNQIQNLKDYSSNTNLTTSERILKVSDLTPIPNKKSNT